MATLREVHDGLLILRRELDTALASDRRCAKMVATAPRDRRPQEVDTGGYLVVLGRLGRGISVEIWVDHYPGLGAPRAWCGVSSSSPQRISQFLGRPPLAKLRQRLIRRSDRDVTKKQPY